jgi:hypothetical protein
MPGDMPGGDIESMSSIARRVSPLVATWEAAFDGNEDPSRITAKQKAINFWAAGMMNSLSLRNLFTELIRKSRALAPLHMDRWHPPGAMMVPRLNHLSAVTRQRLSKIAHSHTH